MIEFSNQFYYYLFLGKTVCKAFELAKVSIEYNSNKVIKTEYHKFLIYIKG